MSTPPTDTVINDRYEIKSRVGKGGMANVYMAYDRLLDRQVAIKVLFPEFAVDPQFVERFRREAQSAASLSHPNIVNVYDWGRYDSTYFIAMEYVSGRTLSEILTTNDRLTPKQAAEIASEVAAALGFAHQGGVAHRDIKPANILIGSNGQVKVADFGIARAMNSATESNLTQAGSVMGTAAYFSPEQAQGAQPDPRSDLYSLGIVMYEMVAGKPPFGGENAVAIAYKQVHDQPKPLNQLIEGVPRSFEAIVAKLLAKNPTLRYPNANDLRDDLRRFRNGEQVQALVAAAARPNATPAAGAPRTVPIDATPIGATSAYVAQPRMQPRPTAQASPTRVNVDAYPPGSSPEAQYYQESQHRTGWYALGAFLALIAVVVGGFWLYQKITNDGNRTAGITLPKLVGLEVDQAISKLRDLGLSGDPRQREDPSVPENYVTETDPAEGTTVVAGSPVIVYFNPSKRLQKVPNVTGKTLDEAKAELQGVGFSVAEPLLSEVSDSIPEGRVIRTEPAADESVSIKLPIKVVVSAGPDKVAMPSVVNMKIEDAKRLLESDQYGLKVNVTSRVDAQVAAGLVLESDPVANQYITRGSEVTLVVSDGPGKVRVPDLKGMSQSQAEATLRSLSLKARSATADLPPGDPNDGKVIEQNLTAGETVPVGTTVEIVIGKALPAPTTTPVITTTTTTVATTTVPESTSAPTTTAEATG